MNNRTFKNPDNDTFIRINKAAAKKYFAAGKNIIICMCNVNPFGYWYDFGTFINNHSDYTFEQFINAYTYYNANNEMGYYPTYYINEKEM